ncbi:MAG: sugar phosphate isomerase/epimerase [Planctomycetales bacterium]|nr:sugar phosphate isomerase/epimerase [Planctomycetales bacterium]
MYKNLNVGYLGVSGRHSEVIELALSHGFKGMDLDIDEFAEQVEQNDVAYAKRLIASARIQVGAFRLPFELGDDFARRDSFDADVERAGKLAELAASVNCRAALVRIDPASDEMPYHQNFERARQRISALADVLKPHGVMLGLEFDAVAASRENRAMSFLASFDALVQLVKMCVADNVGVVADLWQIYVGGGDLEQLGLLSPDKIAAVVLSDLPVDADLEQIDESQRLLPGETGCIDAVRALTMLAEMGYEGPLVPKVSREHLGEGGRDALVKTVADRLSDLWKQAGLSSKGRLVSPVKS